MTPRTSLKRRVVVAVVAYSALIAVVIILHGYLVNERVEQAVWESLLESELLNFTEQHRANPDYQWRDTENLALYGADVDRPIPAAFQNLGAGVHDEIWSGDREYVVLVRDTGAALSVLSLDISDMEENELTLTLMMVGSALLMITVLSFVTFLGANHLVEPLRTLTRSITALRPDKREQRIVIAPDDPQEVALIGDAMNSYTERMDRYIERERTFLRMASHELRTPIAVIAGSAEIALQTDSSAAAIHAQLLRIRQTAHDMQRLVALLLALAKDPSRLRIHEEPIRLQALLPEIVRDHAPLSQGKELTLACGELHPTEILAPLQIVQAAIGNLLRNAIENSSHGVIRISLDRQRTVRIEDPGSGMSPQELNAFYSRLARSGKWAGEGIGLNLIGRLCEHLGWSLNIAARPDGGTIAELGFPLAQ